jgi:hypothetical protein
MSTGRWVGVSGQVTSSLFRLATRNLIQFTNLALRVFGHFHYDFSSDPRFRSIVCSELIYGHHILAMAPLVFLLLLAALATVLLLAFRDSRAIADLGARRGACIRPTMTFARC